VSGAFCSGCETPADHLIGGDSGKEVSQTLRARFSAVSNAVYSFQREGSIETHAITSISIYSASKDQKGHQA
jgi:hypothetical protein